MNDDHGDEADLWAELDADVDDDATRYIRIGLDRAELEQAQLTGFALGVAFALAGVVTIWLLASVWP